MENLEERTMSKKVAYFAYGSNMSTERLQKRVPSAKPIGRAKLPDKRLVCNKKSKDGSGKANLTDKTGVIVWGVLYEIDEIELDKLDEVESGYARMLMKVMTDQGSLVEAHVYVSSELTDDAQPYNWYKKAIIDGARQHHLPESYVEYLKQIKSKRDQKIC